MNKKHLSKIAWLLIILFWYGVGAESLQTVPTIKLSDGSKNSTNLVGDLIEHGGLKIDGDDDLKTQADTENWDMEGTRDGSKQLPFVISGYNFTASSITIVHILNTELYIDIADNFFYSLNGSSTSLLLQNVKNVNVLNNSFYGKGFGWTGAQFQNTSNVGVLNNKFQLYKNNGLGTFYSENITLSNNVVAESGTGTAIWHSKHVQFNQNQIYGNEINGVYLFDTNSSTIEMNDIYNNGQFGIFLGDSFDNVVMGNELSSQKMAIDFNGASDNNISLNIFQDHTEFGVRLSFQSDFNQILRNQFINNNEGRSPQAIDTSNGNVFEYNHWNDLVQPDENCDGIVDTPYIVGSNKVESNKDPYPVVSPENIATVLYNAESSCPTITSDSPGSTTTTTNFFLNFLISTPLLVILVGIPLMKKFRREYIIVPTK